MWTHIKFDESSWPEASVSIDGDVITLQPSAVVLNQEHPLSCSIFRTGEEQLPFEITSLAGKIRSRNAETENDMLMTN